MRVLGDDAVGAATPGLVPMVTKYEAAEGVFTLDQHVVIVTDESLRAEAEYFSQLLSEPVGGKIAVVTEAPASGKTITFVSVAGTGFVATEGYQLKVTSETVRVMAGSPAGAFYACQTMRQLLPVAVESKEKAEAALTMPACSIDDAPRYPWRGALLDSCRHFFPKETVERFIGFAGVSQNECVAMAFDG